MGNGPMTGRGRGFCNDYDRPEYQDAGFGRGFGFGRRFGGAGRGPSVGGRFRAGFGRNPQYINEQQPDSRQNRSLSDRINSLEEKMENLVRKLDK
jgi:hypothetical protein